MGVESGDLVLVVADKNKVTLPVLGSLRLTVAKKLDIIPEGFNFLWITEFPMLEWDEEENRYVAVHHPFTMPKDEDIDKVETDPGACRAKAYDMVLNGVELGGGGVLYDPHFGLGAGVASAEIATAIIGHPAGRGAAGISAAGGKTQDHQRG